MSNLTVLHRVRQIKGSLRQPHHYKNLRRLEMELSHHGWSHPYDKTYSQTSVLLAKPRLNVVPGAQGSVATPASKYIYHLTSVRKVLSNVTWDFFPSGFPSLRHENKKLFDYLVKHYRRDKDWLPLNRYASGKLSGFRDFTWWTSLELASSYILCQAHSLGLPNKWIPKYALIMRCSVDYVIKNNLACVPTVLDGFLSEVFSPTDYRGGHSPGCGRTIDLDGPGPLVDGEEEFAVKPLDVHEIDFQPVLIDHSIRRAHVVRRDARLWQLLEIYYNKL